ncbi:DUF3592 domain-containing protein [Caballeronia sordidicola]|uniref:DUF3592 domain-containing protein n=1 Tax=Caballeronia sordidicola TaxID=196367 RepID=UPI00094ED73A
MAATSPARPVDVRRLFAVFLIFAGVIACIPPIFWGEQILAAHLAATWPTAHGTVVVSKTDRCRGHDGFRPDVRYTYTVAGTIYTGYRIAFGPNSCVSDARATDIAARYPIGSVSIWFDPRDPESAALQVNDVLRETWSSIYWGVSGSIVSLLLGVWCLRLAVRAEQRWKAQGL